MEIENALLSVRVSKLVDLIAMAQRDAVSQIAIGRDALPFGELENHIRKMYRETAEKWLIKNIDVIL